VTAHELAGLEAHNPLGFLAALGLLRVLDDHARAARLPAPRLAFVDRGAWIAALTTPLARDEIVEVILRDAAALADCVAVQFEYDDDGALLPPGQPGTRDLKPSPAAARAVLEQAAAADRRSADLAAAWFTELVTDNNGRAKPTAFHFTAGQQTFLAMVDKLRCGIDAADVREALEGPWSNKSSLPSMAWDASVARLYALRATNPSGEKRGSVPGANWLAVLGLAFFPVMAAGARLATTAVRGTWMDGAFTWPVWSPAAQLATVGSLLRLDAARWSHAQRAAYGIETVYRSRILRADYGSFAPAAVVPPA
jgi:hypothetical protein